MDKIKEINITEEEKKLPLQVAPIIVCDGCKSTIPGRSNINSLNSSGYCSVSLH